MERAFGWVIVYILQKLTIDYEANERLSITEWIDNDLLGYYVLPFSAK